MSRASLLASISILALPSVAAAQTAPPAAVQQADDKDRASDIIVTGDAFSPTDGYLARQSSTGSRFPVDVEKLPNTIRTLPRELIRDTAATLPQDVTKYVSGVQTLAGFGTSTGYVIRGFFANYETLQNGVRVSDFPGDLSNVERIEVLKGPIGSLYGATGAFAGNVNIITKRPRDTFAGSIEGYAGTDDFYRLEGDVGGPLNQDKTIKYRLTGALESAGSFRNGVNARKGVVSPSILFEPNDRLSLRLEGTYLHRSYIFDDGLPLFDGTSATRITSLDLRRGQTFFAPDRTRTHEDYGLVNGEGSYKITDALTLRVGGIYSDYNIKIGSSRLGLTLDPDGRTLERFSYQGPQEIERHTVQADLIWKLRGIGVETVLLAGYENFAETYDYDVSGRALPNYDLLTRANPPAGPAPLTPQFAGQIAYHGNAGYGQVFSQLTHRLSILVGARYDKQRNTSSFNGTFGDPISDGQWSPRVGATWFLTPTTILFGNWAKTFSPNFALDRRGQLFPPDQVRQFEGGVRQRMFGDRALLTLAGFDIRRSNVVIPDITSFAQSIAGGTQVSRGVEVDLTGRVRPGLDLIVTYSYDFTKVASRDDPNYGEPLPAAPRHSASGFIRYTVQDGAAKGLTGTAGLTYASRIQASLPRTIFLPANAQLDLSLAYPFGDGWRAAINVNNVTNSLTYTTTFYSLTPSAPREALFTLTKRFGAGS